MSNSCTPRTVNLFLGIRAVLSLPVKVFPYNVALGNALPQADISNPAISPRPSMKAENCFIGTPEVQERFVLTLPHARQLLIAISHWDTLLFCWVPQHQLSNWPVRFLWTTFSYPLGISDQLKTCLRCSGVKDNPFFKIKIKIRKLLWNHPCL